MDEAPHRALRLRHRGCRTHAFLGFLTFDTPGEYFIKEADENINVTRALIQGSGTVLQTQIDKQDALQTFSKNLRLFSDSFVEADPDLRRLLDKGSVGAASLRAVVDENYNTHGQAVNDLVTANRPQSQNVLGLQAIILH